MRLPYLWRAQQKRTTFPVVFPYVSLFVLGGVPKNLGLVLIPKNIGKTSKKARESLVLETFEGFFVQSFAFLATCIFGNAA